jgi:hypothetical protein
VESTIKSYIERYYDELIKKTNGELHAIIIDILNGSKFPEGYGPVGNLALYFLRTLEETRANRNINRITSLGGGTASAVAPQPRPAAQVATQPITRPSGLPPSNSNPTPNQNPEAVRITVDPRLTTEGFINRMVANNSAWEKYGSELIERFLDETGLNNIQGIDTQGQAKFTDALQTYIREQVSQRTPVYEQQRVETLYERTNAVGETWDEQSLVALELVRYMPRGKAVDIVLENLLRDFEIGSTNDRLLLRKNWDGLFALDRPSTEELGANGMKYLRDVDTYISTQIRERLTSPTADTNSIEFNGDGIGLNSRLSSFWKNLPSNKREKNRIEYNKILNEYQVKGQLRMLLQYGFERISEANGTAQDNEYHYHQNI